MLRECLYASKCPDMSAKLLTWFISWGLEKPNDRLLPVCYQLLGEKNRIPPLRPAQDQRSPHVFPFWHSMWGRQLYSLPIRMKHLKHSVVLFGLQGIQASDILARCCSVQMGCGAFAAPLGHSQLLGSRWDLLRSIVRKVVVEGFCRGFLFVRVIEKDSAPFLSPREFPSLLSP